MNTTKKIQLSLVLFLAVLSCGAVAYGQEGVTSALESMTGLSLQQQLYLTWGAAAVKYLAELYSAVRNGGGLRRIILSFWFGENLPKVVAQDYKKELSTPPFNPPPT